MTDTPTPAPEPAAPGTAQAAPDPGAVTVNLDAKTMAIAVYALYLAGFVTAFLTSIAGVIIAYAMRKDAPEWLRSHFTFQIRTFWIGFIASLVGGATAWFGVGLLILFAAAVWFLVRTVAGLGQMLNNKPYPNPESWLI